VGFSATIAGGCQGSLSLCRLSRNPSSGLAGSSWRPRDAGFFSQLNVSNEGAWVPDGGGGLLRYHE
jgi:hypothetical protein